MTPNSMNSLSPDVGFSATTMVLQPASSAVEYKVELTLSTVSLIRISFSVRPTSESSNSLRSASKILTPWKLPLPKFVLKYTSPWLSSLRTGSHSIHQIDPDQNTVCLVQESSVCRSVVREAVAWSIVSNDAVISNSSVVTDLSVSTV